MLRIHSTPEKRDKVKQKRLLRKVISGREVLDTVTYDAQSQLYEDRNCFHQDTENIG